jgi:hypothetical protein
MWTLRTLEAEWRQVLQGSMSTGTKEDESSTGHVWAAGFHLVARSRLAHILKLLNSLFLQFSNFFFGPQWTADNWNRGYGISRYRVMTVCGALREVNHRSCLNQHCIRLVFEMWPVQISTETLIILTHLEDSIVDSQHIFHSVRNESFFSSNLNVPGICNVNSCFVKFLNHFAINVWSCWCT